ncbi:MAG: MFS transporter [Streptosporangiaceae bacterium]|nr:MFS transporter [Streptosporangiaceae bacterium]
MTALGTSGGQPRPAAAGGLTERWPVAVLSIAQLMFLLDATIVNVALPAIQQAMRLSGPSLEWMVSGYSVPFGGLLLLGGRAGDIIGRRRVFTGGLVLFTAASALGGLAPVSWWLLACRTAQGIGAAAAYPTTLALITATFPDGSRRQRAIGTFTVIAGTGNVAGPLAGGIIVSYLSWRYVMFVNVPIGAFLLAGVSRVLPETVPEPGRFDAAGALSVTGGVVLAIYALITGAAGQDGRAHWGSATVVACLAAAVVLLIAFVVVERRGRQPLVPLRIFGDRGRNGSYVVSILLSTSMFGVVFFLTLFVQRVWGYSPLQTGIIYLPLALVLLAGTWSGGRIMRKTGVRLPLCVGLAAGAAGMAWLSRIGPGSGYATGLLLPSVVAYGGLGLTMAPLTAAAVARVEPGEAGLASGLFSAARQVGGATGLAMLGTVTWTTVAARQSLTAGIERGFAVAAGIVGLALLAAAVAIPREVSIRSAWPS